MTLDISRFTRSRRILLTGSGSVSPVSPQVVEFYSASPHYSTFSALLASVTHSPSAREHLAKLLWRRANWQNSCWCLHTTLQFDLVMIRVDNYLFVVEVISWHSFRFAFQSCRVVSVSMMAMDSGMLVVLIIVAMYMSIVFMLLFFVKNEWCDILNSNLTVSLN